MKLMSILVFAILLTATASYAQGKFGLGIMAGEPSGLSMKYKISGDNAIDGALGWSFAKYGALHIHADYLQNVARLSREVPFYLGVGGRIKTNNTNKGENDSRFGIRVPVGIVYEPSTVPIDVFVEVVPLLDLTPSSDFSMNAAVGIRYYFN